MARTAALGASVDDHLVRAVEIYCVKCRAKTGSRDIEAVTMQNGRPTTRSVYTDCGARKFRIGVLP